MEPAVDTDSRKRSRDDSNAEDDDAHNAPPPKKLVPNDGDDETNGVEHAAAATSAEDGTEPANVAEAASKAEEEESGEPEETEENSAEEGRAQHDADENQASEAKLGPKLFTSSVEMFDFFHDLARNWPVNFDVNKYEFLVLEDLLKKGHEDPEKKIGAGIQAFQVRVNPIFYSRCYYIIRKDGTIDDFSYRKCVDNILPLPTEFKTHFDKKRKGGGQKGNEGRGGRHGGGRGGQARGNRGGSRF